MSINLLVRNRTGKSGKPDKPAIYYAAVPADWRREEKYRFLEDKASARNIEWQQIQPDARHTWLREGLDDAFDTFMPLGTKATKQMGVGGEGAVFKSYSLGVATNRDEWIYDFSRTRLEEKVKRLLKNYSVEVARFAAERRLNPDADVDALVNTDQNFMKWTDRLKTAVQEGRELRFAPDRVRQGVYRPFVAKYIYFDPLLVHRRYQQHLYWPDANAEKENRLIWIKTGGEVPFFSLLVKAMPDLLPQGGSQCFPFYTYAEDGSARRENITDWALQQFRTRYGDPKLSKWDIFHYVYALLHHPQYRERYAANLRRDLPRIPFVRSAGRLTRSSLASRSASGNPAAAVTFEPAAAGDSRAPAPEDAALFHAFAAAGKKLAELHVGYEQQREFPLRRRENPQSPLNWRVEKMRLSKDKSSLTYNDFLTLDGIPPETFEYRLGNRSALEWVIDQYQVSTDKRSGITNDPNRSDDPEYIVRRIAQVITVSLETVKIVKALTPLSAP